MARYHESEVGAPSAAELDEAGYARCTACHCICEAGELDEDTGRCADCMPSRETVVDAEAHGGR